MVVCGVFIFYFLLIAGFAVFLVVKRLRSPETEPKSVLALDKPFSFFHFGTRVSVSHYVTHYECPKCGHTETEYTRYCPQCRAKGITSPMEARTLLFES